MVPRCSARQTDRPRARVAGFHEHEAVEIRAQVPFVAGPGVEEAPRVVAVFDAGSGRKVSCIGSRTAARKAPPRDWDARAERNVDSGTRPLEGADYRAGASAARRGRRHPDRGAGCTRPRRRRGSRSLTGRGRESEHASMMRRSSAGRYDCRPPAGADGSARPEQNVYSVMPLRG